MIEKHCIQPGCNGYPFYGMGKPSSGLMRWACADHRGLIGSGGDAPHPETLRSSLEGPSHAPPAQGRLL